jgi:hypothetical protein
MAGAQERPSVAPAESVCPDAISSPQYAATANFEKLERKEIEARLQEITKRGSADPRVLEQLNCLMKKVIDDR